MDDLYQQLHALEASHLQAPVRASRAHLEALLHPEFTEIGASGKLHTRADTLAHLPQESQAQPEIELTMADFKAQQLTPDLALTTYTTTRTNPKTDPHTQTTTQARRSSIWKREANTWRLFFHQGTPM
tara:strand:- start:4267 stop:4650 length:384 start_codon:yes stop_codon:yes gene_type:complete